MNPDGSFINGCITFELLRIKGDIFSMIEEIRTAKKLKTIPGSCTIDITTTPSNLMFPNRITPCLAPIKPFDETDSDVRNPLK